MRFRFIRATIFTLLFLQFSSTVVSASDTPFAAGSGNERGEVVTVEPQQSHPCDQLKAEYEEAQEKYNDAVEEFQDARDRWDETDWGSDIAAKEVWDVMVQPLAEKALNLSGPLVLAEFYYEVCVKNNS